jgi:DNA-binding NarL/FixJ family response regulator
MHSLSVATRTIKRHSPALKPLAQPALFLVSLDVTVPGTSSVAGRRALRAALGDGSRLFVTAVDKRNDSITFRVDAIARSASDVVGALTAALRRATIGRVRAISANPASPPH